MKMHPVELVVVAIVTVLLSASAFGGTISTATASTVSGPGLGFASVASIATGSQNNDNVPSQNPDLNSVVAFKRFDSTNLIDIQFTVSGSVGISEYKFSEFVDNNSGSPWSSFKMQLGFGTGANFVPSALNDGLDFDFPNYDSPPTSAAFPTVQTPDEDQLVFTGGQHGAGAQSYAFRVDVPDLIGGASPTFTLRETPIAVPEPSTLILAGFAALGLVLYRRHD